jgi:selenoprotein W-related protein
LTQQLITKFKRAIQQLELRPSTGGCFEISFDGKLIYSKLATQRFPEDQEIAEKLGLALKGTPQEH